MAIIPKHRLTRWHHKDSIFRARYYFASHYCGKRYRFNPGRLFDWSASRLASTPSFTACPSSHLRHTFASLAAQAGVGLYNIGTWIGHRVSEVNEIYARLAKQYADIERRNIGEKKVVVSPSSSGVSHITDRIKGLDPLTTAAPARRRPFATDQGGAADQQDSTA